MDKMLSHIDAELMGSIAALAGKDPDDNPFPTASSIPGASFHPFWNTGFYSDAPIYDALYAAYTERYTSTGTDLNGNSRLYKPESVASHKDIDKIIRDLGADANIDTILEGMRARVGEAGRERVGGDYRRR